MGKTIKQKPYKLGYRLKQWEYLHFDGRNRRWVRKRDEKYIAAEKLRVAQREVAEAKAKAHAKWLASPIGQLTTERNTLHSRTEQLEAQLKIVTDNSAQRHNRMLELQREKDDITGHRTRAEIEIVKLTAGIADRDRRLAALGDSLQALAPAFKGIGDLFIGLGKSYNGKDNAVSRYD